MALINLKITGKVLGYFFVHFITQVQFVRRIY